VKTKIEKNMESLWQDIEEHAEGDMTEANVTRLNVCRGAYKALCMVCHADKAEDTAVELARTTETVDGLDGDTEFDRLIMSIPADREHMVEVLNIISDHMEGLKIINNRKYENVMMRLREVART
jgi:hypothetical protein